MPTLGPHAILILWRDAPGFRRRAPAPTLQQHGQTDVSRQATPARACDGKGLEYISTEHSEGEMLRKSQGCAPRDFHTARRQ
ncbi:hypothetical protein KL86DPRO_50102 [uncultured delta proteobacterium]|uniref:Uncharacterized protein n=1 Tax=uncultured delta proteobacterium TaxID=34034 RepID=A0A212KBX9_9DELT|nr:hypothetical protein KL86DPRO_50102 [uncultured delta proteobacterium]